MLKIPLKPTRITPADQHWFFGYYDIPAFDEDCGRHLALHVPFMDRLPQNDDVALLNVIDIKSGRIDCFAETTAWNFQQACMLQWHPTENNSVIYNVTNPETDSGYGSVIHCLTSGKKKMLDRAVAHVASNGSYAVSINFDRLFNFRAGYGYSAQVDPYFSVNHSEEDGVFIVDLNTGKSNLILSLEEIWRFLGGFFKGQDQKICINHITFNRTNDRILMLVRNFYEENQKWHTALLTCDINGNDLFLLSDFAFASHYNWRDGKVLAIYSDGKEIGDAGAQLYELVDKTHTGKIIDKDFFLLDGHNSYSPDLQWTLYDSYPKEDHHRELYLYHFGKRMGMLLGRYLSMPEIDGDIRCDLHPLWAPNGNMISFDSIHEGYRGIYLFDVHDKQKYVD